MTRNELIEAIILELSDERKAKLKKWGKRLAAVVAAGGLVYANRTPEHRRRNAARINRLSDKIRGANRKVSRAADRLDNI